MAITHINNLDQLNKLISQHKNTIIVIDFHAQWCGPCHAIADFYSSLANSNKSLTFTKCDVDQAADVAKHYQVTAMPTFMFLKTGVKIDQVRGADRANLEKLVKKYAGQSSTPSGSTFQGTGNKLGTTTTSTSTASTSTTGARANHIPNVQALNAQTLFDRWNSLSDYHKLGIILFSVYLFTIYSS
ncbi:hypothetical protein Pst134EA_022571 [Puccinia striiformis f. sp. tritici]|nr:hypothetical protein Pst134EA_022571 [Puccinia striiformis f. sp. tritici]KAH9445621.1 hypothetical protein Pst134EB_023457 [Puccinia striiformis f. sp. tritici]KAH9455095.1 hypothetical protein Pst134EA_022571 [Puccinia striiformis f. sp. tritici]KAI9611274.1 hypothetical protein KEM48_004514 [Puccinia striiformis f. sp. tritici PST-130]